uniref:Secreted protein n=1 Tax=Anguilla anguilla TaxID=7936 RepID=A0A0E9U8C1_ANGAN
MLLTLVVSIASAKHHLAETSCSVRSTGSKAFPGVLILTGDEDTENASRRINMMWLLLCRETRCRGTPDVDGG